MSWLNYVHVLLKLLRDLTKRDIKCGLVQDMIAFLETRLINDTLMLDSICHNNESKISLKTHVVIIYGK